jgi:hypothetical protein
MGFLRDEVHGDLTTKENATGSLAVALVFFLFLSL